MDKPKNAQAWMPDKIWKPQVKKIGTEKLIELEASPSASPEDLITGGLPAGREDQAESSIAASTFFAADALSDPDISFAISSRSSTLI